MSGGKLSTCVCGWVNKWADGQKVFESLPGGGKVQGVQGNGKREGQAPPGPGGVWAGSRGGAGRTGPLTDALGPAVRLGAGAVLHMLTVVVARLGLAGVAAQSGAWGAGAAQRGDGASSCHVIASRPLAVCGSARAHCRLGAPREGTRSSESTPGMLLCLLAALAPGTHRERPSPPLCRMPRSEKEGSDTLHGEQGRAGRAGPQNCSCHRTSLSQ